MFCTKPLCLQFGGGSKCVVSSSILVSPSQFTARKTTLTNNKTNSCYSKGKVSDTVSATPKSLAYVTRLSSLTILNLHWGNLGFHSLHHHTCSQRVKATTCMVLKTPTRLKNTKDNLVRSWPQEITYHAGKTDVYNRRKNTLLKNKFTSDDNCSQNKVPALKETRKMFSLLKLESDHHSYVTTLKSQMLKSKSSKRAISPRHFSSPLIDIHSRSIMTSSRPDSVEMSSAENFEGPTLTQMTTCLKKHKLACTIGYTCLVLLCPFCNAAKPTEDKDNSSEVTGGVRNVYINMTTGWTSCQCSRAKGSWEIFQESLDIVKTQKKSSRKSAKLSRLALPLCDDDLQESAEDVKKANALWEGAEEMSRCDRDYLTGLREKFAIQRITVETLESFKLRVDKSQGTLLLPLFRRYDQCDQLIGVRVLDIQNDNSHEKKVVETKLPIHTSLGLFGYHPIKPKTSEIILTECVLDALAVHQETGQAVISLPYGAAMLPQQVLPQLEHFKKITLWFSNDMRSWEACKQFAKKLNSKRCHLIRPLDSHPSPLAALNHGDRLKSIVKNAVPVSHKFITSFRSLRQEVLGELCHAEQVAGIKWKRFVQLNKLLKGHRRGELTVFTGPTGSGKTTFMAEYSLDLCMQGVNTLWGSFEIQNVRLAKVMLTQFTRLNLSKNLHKFDESADKFETLPLYFMDFHGQQSLKKVLEAMSHAAYVHDIQHVIVDNLQFMVGYSDNQTVIDRFSVYDNFIAAFRKFATVNNCHVSLVIHPRKERETEELHTSSIFGSAKASQEADNVLILQDQTFIKPKSRKYIQVAKNRFDGECGRMPLVFNKDSLTMSHIPTLQKKTKTKTSKQDSTMQDNADSEKLSVETSVEDFFEEYTVGDDD